MNRALVSALIWTMGAGLLGGCAAQGPYTALETIDMPGAMPGFMDKNIAQPVGAKIFGAAAGIREVTAISSAGRVDLYVTSDGIVKEDAFHQAIIDSMTDWNAILPNGAAGGIPVMLSEGQKVPEPRVQGVQELNVEFDRARLADAGLTSEDGYKVFGQAREQNVIGDPALASPEKIKQMIAAIKATTLPSSKPLTLGDVADIRVISEPDHITRHWP